MKAEFDDLSRYNFVRHETAISCSFNYFLLLVCCSPLHYSDSNMSIRVTVLSSLVRRMVIVELEWTVSMRALGCVAIENVHATQLPISCSHGIAIHWGLSKQISGYIFTSGRCNSKPAGQKIQCSHSWLELQRQTYVAAATT